MSHLEWSGAERLSSALRIHTERQDAAAQAALQRAALLVERNTKLELSRTAHARGTPTPSRPGSPPAVVSGTLRRSIRTRGPYRTTIGYEALVGPTVIYGRIQELGGVAGRGHRTRLPPRPYMKPALTRSRDQIRRIFRDAWS